MEAPIRLLNRLTNGKDDKDIDILVDTNYKIENYLACKMYEYAVYFERKDILQEIFSLIYEYRKQADLCDSLSVRMKCEYEADGLMAAAVLIAKAQLDNVEIMYESYFKENEK